MTFEQFKVWISDVAKVPLSQIQESSSFRDDLGIDSLQMVNLIVALADTFPFDITKLGSMEDISSVGKMYHLFCRGA